MTVRTVSGVFDCSLVKQSRDGRGILALAEGVGDFHKSDFHYFSFQFNKDDSFRTSHSSVKNMYNKKEFLSAGYVADFCEILNRDIIFYVTNQLNDRHELKCYPILFDCSNDMHMKCAERSERCIFSCASNYFGDVVATGTEYGCSIFHDFMFSYEMALSGYVVSLALNNSGNTLYCGIDSDGLKVIDLREPYVSRLSRSKQYKSLQVAELRLLSSETSMIVCGEDGSLSKVDFHNFMPVINYLGHVSSGRKPIISVNEDLDLLCVTGSDNVTRLWSLSSGSLLHIVGPPMSNERTHGCLITDRNKWFVALLQKHRVWTVQPKSK